MKVAVIGCSGRMGREVVAAVSEAEDLDYVGGVDPAAPDSPGTYGSVSDLLESVRPDVAVEFSVPEAVYANCRELLEAGVYCVVGATGITAEQREELGSLADSRGISVLIAPNFSVGAVMMMQLARIAAPHFASSEIIEIHHERKADAPSGTSLMTAELISASRESAKADTSQPPARGQAAGSVRVHSVRLPGYTAHQEVLFASPGEALTIRHDTFDRKSFMPGVLLGIRRIRDCRGLIYGLEHFLLNDEK